MRKGYASALLVVVGFAALAALTLKNKEVSSKTELFSSVQTADDREFLAIIREENLNSANTFTLAVNKFADRTHDEYKRLLGYKPAMGPKNATA